MIRMPAAAILALAVSGCASSLSGVGGTERYACKAPEGALCTSVSGVYANSIHGAFRPAERQLPRASSAPPAAYGATPLVPDSATALDTFGTPRRLRSNARVLRVWIAPWEDSDGDLHEASTVHVLVDTGRWLIEHVRPAKGSRVDGVAPPPPPLIQEAAPAKTPIDPLPAEDVLPPAPGSSPAASDATPVEP
jgi:conjugal transfer pilus assembly protein TraV